MEAILETDSWEASQKKLIQGMEQIGQQAKKTSGDFNTISKSTEEAVGSISSLEKEATQLNQVLKKLDPDTKAFRNTAKDLNVVMGRLKDLKNQAATAGTGLRKSFDLTKAAAQGLSFGLGILGVQSIGAVVQKTRELITQSTKLAIALEGVEARSRAIFQGALPQVTEEIDKAAKAARRSSSDMMEMATGFGALLDSAGATQGQVSSFSVELSKLAVILGKAFPDRTDVEIYSQLEAGILGNTRGLRQLGIVMNDKALQDFADHKNIRVKVKDMTDEQLMVLRSQYLMEQTTKLQDAAASSTKKMGDEAKSTSAKWKDMLETMGKSVGPAISGANAIVVDILSNWVMMAGAFKRAVLEAVSLGTYIGADDMKGLNDGVALDAQNRALQTSRGVGLGTASKGKAPAAAAALKKQDSGFWDQKGGSDGGGGAEKREEAEKKLIEALQQQAKLVEEQMKIRREDLMLRQKLGILTTSEARELETINRRLMFKKDLIDEATKAWEEQVQALDEVDKKIADINDRIIEEHKRLKDSLADIDRDGARDKAKIASDLLTKKNELEAKMTSKGGQGLTSEESFQYGELQDQLRGADPSSLAAGEKTAGLNEFQKIDAEMEQKKKDAAMESNARTEGLVNELTQAQINKQQIVAAEQEKRDAVVLALNERLIATTTAQAAEITATEAYVKRMSDLYSQLAAAAAQSSRVAAPAVRRAAGGPIFGPGGPTDDLVPALLSNGEHVLTASEVRAAGGHGAIMQFRDALRSGVRLQVPRFAAGGPVTTTHDQSRTVNQHIHYHGSASRAMSSPSMIAWAVRANIR